MAVIKDLGAVTAYAAAVEGGYTGTKAEFETLMASYATVAEEAAESAESASQSAESASASAQTATTKASEASTSATQASASATSASQSAQTATAKASEASASASTASTKASDASQSASTASTKASEASASATSAQTAQGLAESARDDAIDAKTDAESARDLAQQYAESIDPEKIYSAYPTDTASGSVASFADGADDIPMKSVKVAIEPVQDLHGYDHPWPAGGGKNLLQNIATSATVEGVVFTVNSDGTVNANGTASANAYFKVCEITLPAGSYVLSGCPANGSTSTYKLYDDANWADTGTGATITFSESVTKKIYIRVNSGVTVNNLVFKPMICLASATDPTVFAPYSNICPISGFTGCEVGKTASASALTLGGIVDNNGSETAQSTRLKTDFIAVSNLESIDLVGADQDRLRAIHYYDANKTWIKAKSVSVGYDIPKTSEFDEPENYAYIRLVFQHVNSTETESADGKLAVVNYSTYPITFPSEAGTVYGGTLDVTSGVLTVDRVFIASYNGETLPPEWISDRDKYVAGTTPTTGAQVVYKLATPITYTLTPTEIKSLLGDNNVWADAGDTSVTYRADTAKYIDKKIAEVINALS